MPFMKLSASSPSFLNSDCFQIYAPTTLAPARDFWTIRYTTNLDNGSLVVSISLSFSSPPHLCHVINVAGYTYG